MAFGDKIKMRLPSDFFQEEVRCDYKVTEKTKKVWAVELDLLHELLCVCQKHQIKICMFAGTLLGTIRHKGFIPWDDDIDVCMTRAEYEKLLAISEKAFKYPYFFQTALSDRSYFFGYARLRNSLTTGYITEYQSDDYNQGIFIDIFVLDGYVDDEAAFTKQIQKRTFLTNFADLYGMRKAGVRLSNFYVGHLVKTFLCKIIPYQQVVKAYHKNLSKYNSETNRLALLTHPVPFIRKYWCKKEDLEHLVYMPFENIQVPVPSNYDEVLKTIYGNYMAYPPVNERGAWHEGQITFDPDIPYQEFKNRKK